MDNAQVTQKDLHDAIYGDHGWRRKEVQAIGAAISTRNWHSLEMAYNNLRDKMDARHRLERSEPVGWMYDGPDGQHYINEHRDCAAQQLIGWGWTETPLYTTPPEPVAEIERLRDVLAYIAAEAAASVSSYGEMDVHAFERIEKVAAQALGDKA